LDLEKLEAVIRPVVEGSGFRLYDIEFFGRILRVTIEKEGGTVGIDDCVSTSRILNPLLDTDDLVAGSFDLEVSSPGLDRSLRKPEHFTGALGQSIHVTTSQPLSLWNGSESFFEMRRNITGLLQEFDGTDLKIQAENYEVKIPVEAVLKAYINFELKTTPKKGKKV